MHNDVVAPRLGSARFAFALCATLAGAMACAKVGLVADGPPDRVSAPVSAGAPIAPVEAQRLALAVLDLDFQRSGVSASADAIAERYAAACAAGHAVSCQWQTWHIADTPLLGLAAAAHRPACAAGEDLACLVVAWDDADVARGEMLVTPPRPARHAALIAGATSSTQRLCAGGLLWACSELGLIQAGRYGGEAHVDAALTTWRKACASSDARSCAFLATTPDAGAPTTEQKAFADRACAIGSLITCFRQIEGDLYDEPDEARLASYQRLCRQGVVAACGAPKRNPSPDGLKEACRLRDPISCTNHARLLLESDEPEQSPEYIRQACRAFVGLCSLYVGMTMQGDQELCGRGDTGACARMETVQALTAPLLKEQARYRELADAAAKARASEVP